MNIDDRITQLKKEIENLEDQKVAEQIEEKYKKTATLLHEQFCHWNHIDGCSWMYDDDKWIEPVRKEYLRKAEKLLQVFTEGEIETFLSIVKHG